MPPSVSNNPVLSRSFRYFGPAFPVPPRARRRDPSPRPPYRPPPPFDARAWPGGLPVPAGDASVPTGFARVPSGCARVPTGCVHVPRGCAHVPTGCAHVPRGCASVPKGFARVPRANARLPTIHPPVERLAVRLPPATYATAPPVPRAAARGNPSSRHGAHARRPDSLQQMVGGRCFVSAVLVAGGDALGRRSSDRGTTEAGREHSGNAHAEPRRSRRGDRTAKNPKLTGSRSTSAAQAPGVLWGPAGTHRPAASLPNCDMPPSAHPSGDAQRTPSRNPQLEPPDQCFCDLLISSN